MRIGLKFCLIIVLIIFADQFSKYCVQQYFYYEVGFYDNICRAQNDNDFKCRYYEAIALTPFLNISYVWNKGITFGMLSDVLSQDYLVVLSILIILYFAYWLFRVRNQYRMMIELGALIVGGAIANVIDRVRYGAVFDFIDFHVLGYHYYSFNLADSAIIIGLFGVILSLCYEKKIAQDGKAQP